MRRERGQATVEFALVGILILTLYFVLIDGARLVFIYQTVGEASREGAHTGQLINSSDDQIRAAIAAHSGYLGPLASTAIFSPEVTRTVGGQVSVTVHYQYRTVTPFLSQFGPLDISSTTVVVVE
jgi:Flp pilus assembly protein TadG